MKNLVSVLLLSILTIFSSCKDDETISIDNPATYTFERDGTSTISFEGQTTRVKMATELINAMTDFATTEAELLEMYRNQTATGEDVNPYTDADLNISTKSIKSKVAASVDYFGSNTAESALIKADFETWIGAQANEVSPNAAELATPGIAGQIADGSSVRYVSAKGLEYNQAVNKALIGGLMLDQMVNNYLSTSILDAGENRANNDATILVEGKNYTDMEHKWDEAYGYLFALVEDVANPLETYSNDSFFGKYLSRVEGDSDFAGIADDIYQAFKLGRAAIVTGDYDVRNEQAAILRNKLSQMIGIRAVYYLQAGKNALPTDGNDYGSAFHDLSEGFGFVYSLRFVRSGDSNAPVFTRAEVDGFLDQIYNIPANGFWEVTPETLDAVSAAIAAKFDFTVAQAAE